MAMGNWGECVSIHTALITDRGGSNRIFQFSEITEVSWGRTVSGITTATVTIVGAACAAQADRLNRIRSNRHELVLFRGEKRVWEGVIRQVGWFADRVIIEARDVFEYVDNTPLTIGWPNSDNGGSPDMLTRVLEILTYELTEPYVMSTNQGDVTVERWETLSVPVNILPFLDVRAGSVLTRSDTMAFEMTVGEHLKNLAESGMDFTTIGRSLVFWDSAQAIGRTRKLTEADFFGELEVYETGPDYAAIGHISAQREVDGEDERIGVGNAGTSGDDYYGPWTVIHTASNEDGSDTPDQTELNSQAQRLRTSAVPTEIRVPTGSSIRLGAGLTIDDLVAGTEMPVEATLNLRKVRQMMRLVDVKVTETPNDESIAVTLKPAGALMLAEEP